MRCGVSTVDLDADSFRTRPLASGDGGFDLARSVSSDEPYAARDPRRTGERRTRSVYRVAAYDFGLKRNILRRLAAAGIEATVVPATTPAAEVRSGGFDGVVLSNGPGDPAATTYGIGAPRLLGTMPVFGICLGHQPWARARRSDLQAAVRAPREPTREGPAVTGRVEVTSHNHGFAVEPDGWPARSERRELRSGASRSHTGT